MPVAHTQVVDLQGGDFSPYEALYNGDALEEIVSCQVRRVETKPCALPKSVRHHVIDALTS